MHAFTYTDIIHTIPLVQAPLIQAGAKLSEAVTKRPAQRRVHGA